MDGTDRKLLSLLQRDAQRTTAQIAEDVGLSLSACAKRLARLKHDGSIASIVARLDPKKFPKPVTAAVTLDTPKTDVLRRFARLAAEHDEIQQCHAVTGDFDYLLIVTAPSIEAFFEFAQEVLGSSKDVRAYKSTFVLQTVKNENRIPEFCLERA